MRAIFLAALFLAILAMPAKADSLIDFTIVTDTGASLSGEMDAIELGNPNDFAPISILSLSLNGTPVLLPDTIKPAQTFGSSGGGAGAGKLPAITLDGSVLSIYASLSTGTSYFALEVLPGGNNFVDFSTDYGGSGNMAQPSPGFWTANVVPEPAGVAVFASACFVLALVGRARSER